MESVYKYQKTCFSWSLIFATIGVLSALLLVFLFDGSVLIFNFPKQIFVAVVALYGSAAGFGYIAGNLIFKINKQKILIYVVGIGLALSTLIISCLAGSAITFLSTKGSLQDFGNYIIKPFLSVLLIGIIPASILGLLYSTIIKTRLRIK